MKVLAIAPQPFFSPRGTPFSVYYRTLIMAHLGCQVDLLTYGEGADVDIPGVRIIRIPSFPFFGRVKVGPSFLKLFLDIFISLYALGLLIRNRYTFVHAHEEAVFICSFLKPFFHFKLVYDMHSSLPQQLDNFKFTTSKIIIGIFKKLEDRCLSMADAVITICPDLANYALSHLKDSNRHFLIENSLYDPIMLTEVGPKTSSEKMFEYEEACKFVKEKSTVVYAGTLEPYQGIDLLLDAFQQVNRKRPELRLLIVGGRPDQVSYYVNYASEKGLAKAVHFSGQVPPDAARSLSSKATVLVSPRTRGTNTPLKIYEQLDSGLPLVATKIYSHTQVLDDKVAILVDPEPKAMADGLLEAFNSENRVKEIIEQSLQLYKEKYSRDVYEKKIKAMLEHLKTCAA